MRDGWIIPGLPVARIGLVAALVYGQALPPSARRCVYGRRPRRVSGKDRCPLPRHKAANWVGSGRGRKSTRPGVSCVVELSPFEFLDRLSDLVPPPRKHRHRLPP